MPQLYSMFQVKKEALSQRGTTREKQQKAIQASK